MDTSISDKSFDVHQAFDVRNYLLDRKKIDIEEVPPQTWLMIFDFLMETEGGILGRIPGVFVPLSDLMSGEKKENQVHAHVPRRLTCFQKGISPTTRVFSKLVFGKTWGVQVEGKTILLLVSQPQNVQHHDVKWAKWLVGYDADGKVATSEVHFVDSESVHELFSFDRGLASDILDSLMLSLDHAVQEQAKVRCLLRTVEGIMERLK